MAEWVGAESVGDRATDPVGRSSHPVPGRAVGRGSAPAKAPRSRALSARSGCRCSRPYLDLRTNTGAGVVSTPVGEPTGPRGWSPRIIAGEGRTGTSLRPTGPPVIVSRPRTQAPTAPLPTSTAAVRRRRDCFSMWSTAAQASTAYREPSSCGGGSTDSGAERQLEPTLDHALVLDQPTTSRAGEDVRPGPLRLGGGQLAVDQRRRLRTDVSAERQHHRTCPAMRGPIRRGPANRVRPGRGARWASAVRSWARPRWMRERTVPSLRPRTSAISS